MLLIVFGFCVCVFLFVFKHGVCWIVWIDCVLMCFLMFVLSGGVFVLILGAPLIVGIFYYVLIVFFNVLDLGHVALRCHVFVDVVVLLCVVLLCLIVRDC